MSLIAFVLSLFTTANAKALKILEAATHLSPKEKIFMSDQELEYALKFFRARMHEGLSYLGNVVTIPRVICHTKFSGWGFVEGETKGIRVNHRVTLISHDDDMDFTSMCILVDHLPTIIIRARSGVGLHFYVIGEERVEDVFRIVNAPPPELTVETLRTHPQPVQDILHDVVQSVWNYNEAYRNSSRPTAKALTY